MDSLAARLGQRSRASLVARRADALQALLADTEGFTGDTEDYDAPANADFLSMLDRKRGLPITLAILYVALARRVGWQADILGVPGHALVALGASGSRIILDPFAGGRTVSADWLAVMVGRAVGRGTAVRPDHVLALSNGEALVRLLMNPARRARDKGDTARALTLYRRMTAIAPATPDLWWDRARLEYDSGDRTAARRSLIAMQETTRSTRHSERIEAFLKALAR